MKMAARARQFLPQAAAVAVLILGPAPGWSNQTAAPFAQWEDKEKEQFLLSAKLVKTKGIPTGVTGTRRATLSNAQATHDAHLQTIDVEKARFTTVRGTEFNFRDSYKFNIAAYRLDRLVGLNVVPVSVERKIKGKTGSVTWWVDDVQMMELERHNKKIAPPNRADWNDQMYNVRVFNELVYNNDPNLGNFLITNDWRLRMVDFSRAFRTLRKLRTPANLTRIDRRVYEGLRALDRVSLEKELGAFLKKAEIQGILARRDRILAIFNDHIAKNGENRVVCDRAGH